MRKERVILTGSEGLIGSALAADLGRTHEVLRLSRRLGHDLTDEAFVKTWFARHPAEYLVLCHGFSDPVLPGGRRATLFDVPLEGVADFLKVNVVSAFSCCREFARRREARGIVLFSSIYGLVSPAPELYGRGEKHVGYSVSKAAVAQLARHLAVHLAPRVRVNCLAPGGVRHTQGRRFLREYGRRVPLRRMMARGELCGLVRHLCSEDSSYMTGSILTVDGGWTAR